MESPLCGHSQQAEEWRGHRRPVEEGEHSKESDVETDREEDPPIGRWARMRSKETTWMPWTEVAVDLLPSLKSPGTFTMECLREDASLPVCGKERLSGATGSVAPPSQIGCCLNSSLLPYQGKAAHLDIHTIDKETGNTGGLSLVHCTLCPLKNKDIISFPLARVFCKNGMQAWRPLFKGKEARESSSGYIFPPLSVGS